MRLAQFLRERYWPAVAPTLGPEWRETVEKYRLPELCDDLGSYRLAELTPEVLEIWWGRQRSRHATSTANKNLGQLKKALDKAVQWGYLAQSPARYLKQAKEATGRVKWYTPEQRRALWDSAGPTLRAYCLFAYYTGLRRKALVSLRKGWVDTHEWLIRVPRTKNGDPRTVPVHSHLRPLVLELLGSDPQPLDPLLPQVRPDSISKGFRRLARRLGLKDFRFHDWRHDVGSTLAMKGANQRLIMDVLGHRDPRSTARYTHLSTDAVRKAMEETL